MTKPARRPPRKTTKKSAPTVKMGTPRPYYMANISPGPVPALDALGVPYHMEYGEARSRFVRSIQIPWTAEQWCGVVHREGQWLGVCCGTISGIRDYLIGALADGGWVEMKNLVRIIDLMKSHDGFDEWFKDGYTPTAEILEDPLYLLAQVWNIVKDLRWASWLDVPKKRDPENRAKHSSHALKRALEFYDLTTLFHVGEYTTPEAKVEARFRHDKEVALALAGVIPALREFNEYIASLPKTPLVGVAVVHKGDRDNVCDTAGGPAIYENEAKAKEVIAYWCTNDQDEAPKPEDFELRPVSVTWDKGLEFTDNKVSV